jgi:hypothetical protein
MSCRVSNLWKSRLQTMKPFEVASDFVGEVTAEINFFSNRVFK